VNDGRPPQDTTAALGATPPVPSPQCPEFAVPVIQKDEYTDGRKLWDWQTKYPPEARRGLNREAWSLCGGLVLSLIVSGCLLGLANQSLDFPLHWQPILVNGEQTPNQSATIHVDFRILMIFFVGCVGGTTFSIKWLVHSAAKGKWHLDRRYWRMFVPLLGGVYACVVLTLFEGGFIGGGQPLDKARPVALVAAFAFLVGYFSDGVSGLLSNIANAVFGTLEKK
jgi:hypothetical protein